MGPDERALRNPQVRNREVKRGEKKRGGKKSRANMRGIGAREKRTYMRKRSRNREKRSGLEACPANITSTVTLLPSVHFHHITSCHYRVLTSWWRHQAAC
jgi:hypothetical protein